ncbi:uncharacterized protein TRIADDRAFT_58082 [Trichoplax adhaerens]|uniref:Uncharacterized protein n=1 Tax=Trichoplax adhaerens TaxID=10228 RepID=B3S2M7_TRIAD|nr:hypothetical protein TRIADDRAFT_58082 [Trichoplax adhaerens]EDV23123.1 hypothetical protein TRIADDRAFT_58082 [Trichoplax adhaerens]|eukprot:XP_002114033.1 hypothetical protein TRIADDRAFT_58082 [Trichoplax adhaerens]
MAGIKLLSQSIRRKYANHFPEKIFWRNTPSNRRTDAGLDSKYFMWLLNSNKACDADLHRTVNMYSAEYNRKNILRAIEALRNRQLSFDQIYISRLAYQLYEEDDLTGLKLNEDIIMKTIKLCGRVIAPLRLYHEIRNLKKNRHREDRAVYYEFIDILLRCNLKEEVPHPRSIPFEIKKKGELYDVCDFDALLHTLDERLLEQLQKRYSRAQMMALKRQLQSKLIFQKQQTLLIGSDERDEMIQRENRDFDRLSEFLMKSESLLRQAKCGGTQYRNYSIMGDQESRKVDSIQELCDEESKSLLEFDDHLISRSATAQLQLVKAAKSRQERNSRIDLDSDFIDRISTAMNPFRNHTAKKTNLSTNNNIETSASHDKSSNSVPDIKQRAATSPPKIRRIPQYFEKDEKNRLQLYKDSVEWDMVSMNQRTQQLLNKMHSKYEREKYVRNVHATWRDNTYQVGPKVDINHNFLVLWEAKK